MSEYRHIANLKGPQGRDATEIPGAGIVSPQPIGGATDYQDTDALDPGHYYNVSNASGLELGLPGGARIGSLDVAPKSPSIRTQTYSTNLGVGHRPYRAWVRGMDLEGQYLNDWLQIYPHAGEAPARKILELAERDNWMAVYDPSNPETIGVNDEGGVESLRDGLGNLSALFPGDDAPQLKVGEYGQLNGMGGSGGYLTGDLGGTLSQPVTYLMVAQAHGPATDDNLYLLSGGHTAWITRVGGSARFITHGGYNAPISARHDSKPHLIRATFNAEGESTISIDGEVEGVGVGANSTTTLTIGAHSTGDERRWPGTYGPTLILQGDADEAKIARMSQLLMNLAGIGNPSPRLDYGTVVYSEDSDGEPTFIQGHPDAINEGPTVASITKVMTLWVARKYLSESDMAELVEVDGDDLRGSNPRLAAGDQVSYRDLFYMAAMPSDNTAPNVIARSVGEVISASPADARDAFIQEMNDEAESLGYEGADFRNPQFGALLSPKQVADLFRRSIGDPILREAHKIGQQQVSVIRESGSTETLDLTHSSTNYSPFALPGVFAAKTGTNYGYGHVVTAWEHPDGSEHITVILNASSSAVSRRYRELRKVMGYVIDGGYVANL